VLLDSGMGVPAMGWMKVQPEVAKFTHVCSYDRAGYGWSDPGPEPRTSAQIATELKAVLDAAGERGPFVLVGHSFGGFNVRVFAGLQPKQVLGMVLVDASHEDWKQRLDTLLSPDARESLKQG
jgi:pimeloyl-ACP methyl ester carboxylesterase